MSTTTTRWSEMG